VGKITSDPAQIVNDDIVNARVRQRLDMPCQGAACGAFRIIVPVRSAGGGPNPFRAIATGK
jgi:hypothetical protein